MGRRAGVKNGMGRAHDERRKETTRLMVGVGLAAKLDLLVDDILDGKTGEGQLSEFQEFIQYAPSDLRERVQRKLEMRLP